jgi:hypothetical protein
LQSRTTADFLILEFQSESEDNGGDEEGEGQLAGFPPVRAELITGDLRALNLGWLASAQDGFLEDGAVEPPLPPGLGQPSAAFRWRRCPTTQSWRRGCTV